MFAVKAIGNKLAEIMSWFYDDRGESLNTMYTLTVGKSPFTQNSRKVYEYSTYSHEHLLTDRPWEADTRKHPITNIRIIEMIKDVERKQKNVLSQYGELVFEVENFVAVIENKTAKSENYIQLSWVDTPLNQMV